MTTFTQEHALSLFDEQEQVVAFYRAGMAQGIDPEIIAGALALEVEAKPELAAPLHDCMGPGCDKVTSDPVRDEQAVFWIGDAAETYCSDDCMSNAGEARAVPA
jgi:hypothetical protein